MTHSVMGGWHSGHCGSREKGSPRNNQGRLPGGGDMPTDCGKSGCIFRGLKEFCFSLPKTNGARKWAGPEGMLDGHIWVFNSLTILHSDDLTTLQRWTVLL